ncbi:MAG: hypothetical protein KJ666_04025 [Bacteroidetes bacterium]|nr:hypothetical protein [Bacteroidota bacterium]
MKKIFTLLITLLFTFNSIARPIVVIQLCIATVQGACTGTFEVRSAIATPGAEMYMELTPFVPNGWRYGIRAYVYVYDPSNQKIFENNYYWSGSYSKRTIIEQIDFTTDGTYTVKVACYDYDRWNEPPNIIGINVEILTIEFN